MEEENSGDPGDPAFQLYQQQRHLEEESVPADGIDEEWLMTVHQHVLRCKTFLAKEVYQPLLACSAALRGRLKAVYAAKYTDAEMRAALAEVGPNPGKMGELLQQRAAEDVVARRKELITKVGDALEKAQHPKYEHAKKTSWINRGPGPSQKAKRPHSHRKPTGGGKTKHCLKPLEQKQGKYVTTE